MRDRVSKLVQRWLWPEVEPRIRVELERRQLLSIQQHVPTLYLVAVLNILILMAVCAHVGFAPSAYGWMGGIVLLALVRTGAWVRTARMTLTPAKVTRALQSSGWVAFLSMLGMGAFASVTFVLGTFERSTLIPISLALGSMSIAHCLATVRAPAVASVALGVVPVSVAMVVAGDFHARVLGVSLLSVAGLMIRFVAVQVEHLVTELKLQREVYDLANTDALTQVHNRRALMAVIERELARGPENTFGLALLDLDGFKPVNDRLGHLAGDELLKVVARRLVDTGGEAATVGRLGGDEFLVVLHRVASAQDLADRIAQLRSGLCRPTELAGETVMVRSSIGGARFPKDGATAPALIAVADAALYADKTERTRNGERVVAPPSRVVREFRDA